MIILRLNCRRCGCDRNKARLLQNKTPRRDSATEQFQRRSSRCDVGAFACGAMRWDGGGARRDRTADLLHAMQALSQLSYGPNQWNLSNRYSEFWELYLIAEYCR